MKLKRTASLLLSLVLSFSCIPAASLNASEPVDEEISYSSYSSAADAEVVTVTPENGEAGNKFLTVYDRNYNWSGAKIQFDAKTGTTYTLTFRARLTVDTDSIGAVNPQLRVMPYDPKNTSCVKINDRTNQLVIKQVGADGWTEFEIKNMQVSSAGTAMLLILPYGANYHWYSFDIDDVKVVDASGNFAVNNDFEALDVGAMAGDQVLTDAYGGKIINYRYDGNAKYTASFAVNKEDTYYEIDASNGSTLAISVGKRLEPGTYTGSIKLRNNEYKSTSPYLTSTDNQNSFTAYAVAYTDANDSLVIGSSDNAVTVTDNWTELSFTLNIEQTTLISKVNLVLNHTVDSHSTIKLNFKDLTFNNRTFKADVYFDNTAKPVVPGSEDDGNKFLSVYGRNYNWSGAKIQFEAATDATYTLTFKAKLTVDSDSVGGVTPQLRVMPYDPKGTCVKINDSTKQLVIKQVSADGWTEFEIKNMKVSTPGTAMLLVLPYGASNHWYSFDIDDVKIADANGNIKVNNDFESYEAGAMPGDPVLADEYGGKIINYRYDGNAKYTSSFAVNIEETYYEMGIANGNTLTATLNKELDPGTYTYSIKLRNNEYKADSSYLTSAGSQNSFTAYAMAYTEAGGDAGIGSDANTVTVGENWTELLFRFNIKEATTLSRIDVVVEHTVDSQEIVKLNFKDMILTSELLDIDEDDRDSIILFGDDYYNDDNAGAKYVPAKESGNKYLTVSGRNYHWTGVKVRFDAVKDETYTLSFNIRANTETSGIYNGSPRIRVFFGDPQLDKNNPVVGNAPAQLGGNNNIREFGSEWTPVVFDGIKALDSGTLTLPIITLGHQTHIYSYDIDEIKVIRNSDKTEAVNQTFTSCRIGEAAPEAVFYDSNGGEVLSYIYNKGKKVTLSVVADEPYFAIDVKNSGTLNVDINKELKPGIYTYSIKLRNAEFNAAEEYVNYSNKNAFVNNNTFDVYAVAYTSSGKIGSSARTRTIGDSYTEFTFVFNVEEAATLEKLALKLNHYVDSHGTLKVCFKEPSLSYSEPEKEDESVNLGIIMMLLLKKSSGMPGVAHKEPDVGLIKNGSFSSPVIIKDILTNNQTKDDAGWYAKFSEDSKTKISQVVENQNAFLRAGGVTSGQRGVYFNSGVILQPGKYTLNAYLRIAANDVDGMWRDTEKSTMQMRINLQNPENPNVSQHSLNNGVDKDTTYAADGNVIGTLVDIGRDWTLYTDTITVETPTLAIFKIGGGVGGAVDAHDFDIDNLTLVPEGTDYTPSAPVEIIEFFDSIVKNGNFALEPKIVEGVYNAEVTDTWFSNSGMDYQYDTKGAALKDQPKIMHKMNLTYKDGYLTLTGREINLKAVSFTPSEILEPGEYSLSIDFKTPNKGEKTVVRVYIYTPDGKTQIFNPGSTNVANVTNDWSTYTCKFEIKTATAIRIELKGGPNATYTQDYSFDNVVLKKVD